MPKNSVAVTCALFFVFRRFPTRECDCMRPYEVVWKPHIVRDNKDQYATKQQQQPPKCVHRRDSTGNKSTDTIVWNVRIQQKICHNAIHWQYRKIFSSRRAPSFSRRVLRRALTESIIPIRTRDGKRGPPQRYYTLSIGINIGVWQTRREFRWNGECFILHSFVPAYGSCSTTLHSRYSFAYNKYTVVQPLLFARKAAVGKILSARLTFNTWAWCACSHNRRRRWSQWWWQRRRR